MSPAADSHGPFSHPNRVRLIDEYFGERRIDPHEAWKDVYRLLLWSDPTTGLAHCYESDKAQPGRPWYARTLAFHAWLADQFAVRQAELPDALDWMFRRVIKRVADEDAARRQRLIEKAATQREPYEAGMPAPGEDSELHQIIEPLLPRELADRPNDELVSDVLQRVRVHIASENKRKNLLGRGFEDVLAGVIRRVARTPPETLGTQTPIEQIRGFRPPRDGDKTEKVDLWVEPDYGGRTLVSAKWSVRSDREKQMRSDFLTYIDCNELREPFEYVWVTNEFDPARLVANATATYGNSHVFAAVVHICPRALELVHELDKPALPKSCAELKYALDTDRIISLGRWLSDLRSG